ncbi:potassium channel family protein [Halomonas sp. WWR20]
MDEHPLWGMLGVLLILGVAYDCIKTTLSASSSGPLTNRLTKGVWSLLLRFHRRRPQHKLLGSAGTWITFSLVLCWLVFTWLGWFLVFSSSPQAVVNSTSMVTASLMERLYFIGYTITTLGYGDFVPGAPQWRLLATLAAGNGFLLFTLSVTYAIPILSAATEKRQLALSINVMGRSPLEIIESHVGKGDFQSLCNQLQQIQGSIAGNSQKHLAYPILHFFHSVEEDTALALALARLDEALSIILYSCPELPATSRSQLLTAQRVIDEFLHTLEAAFIYPAREAPPIPDLKACSSLPFLAKSPEAIRAHLSSLDRQRLLLTYVENDGWQWREMWQTEPLPPPS